MRIGIDGRNLNTGRAIFRYTKNLVNSLARLDTKSEFFLFLDGQTKLQDADFLSLTPNWRLVAAPSKWVLRDHLLFKHFIDRFNLDIFLHPDNTEFLFCHPKSVVVLHDLIPYLLPNQTLSPNQLDRLRQRFYLYLQRKALKSSAAIITVSQNSKADISRLFGIDEEKITVVYEGTESSFKPPSADGIENVLIKFKLGKDYFLCHSGFSPYKNLLCLVEAFDFFSKEFPAYQLVLSGKISDSQTRDGGKYYQSVRKEVERRGLASKVIFAGFVEEADLPALYGGARGFVYPSLYEGFGLTPLEAQACGTPVACSNRASLPEVVGKSALMFDPEKTSEISDALLQLAGDENLRRQLIDEGLKNVSRFSWEACAAGVLKVLVSIYGTS
ncbi:MAG: glycosyltransferase family 4 protein [Patescibacteria group bacterium]|nr:glycosyltransferase family 4 protein [Patescibacteria group bacterium]